MDTFLAIVLLSNFFVNASGSILGPFFPDIANSKDVFAKIIGIIYAVYYLAMFLGSAFIGKYMSRIGKKRSLVIGILGNSISLGCFALANHIDDKITFIILCCGIRFVQGVSVAFYSSVNYSFMPLLYPDSAQQKIGFLEATTGFGYVVGPPLGSLILLVTDNNYDGPFLVTSGIVLACFFLMIFKLPNIEEIDNQKISTSDNETIGFFKFLFNLKMFLTFLIVCFGILCINYFQPVYATYLHKKGIEAKYMGFVYAIPAIAYIFSLILIGSISSSIDRRIFLIGGSILLIVAYTFAGPDPLLSEITDFPFIFSGMIFLGLGSASVLLPGIPEFISIGKKIFPQKKEAVIDMASALLNVSAAFGGSVGPILASVFTDEFGFARGSTVFSGCLAVLLCFYIVFGDGYKALISPKMKIDFLEEGKESLKNNLLDETETRSSTVTEAP